MVCDVPHFPPYFLECSMSSVLFVCSEYGGGGGVSRVIILHTTFETDIFLVL